MTRLIFLILLLTSCKEEPRGEVVSPIPPRPTAEVPSAGPITQPKVVPPARSNPGFDSKLQHIQEQVNWVDKRIGP